jgi:hypothetical protein
MTLADIAGWIGAVLVVGAYAATTLGTSLRPVALHTANLAGSAGLAVVAAANHSWPSVLVNGIWLTIAGGALARFKGGSRQGRRQAEKRAVPDSARTTPRSAVCASESEKPGLIAVGER